MLKDEDAKIVGDFELTANDKGMLEFLKSLKEEDFEMYKKVIPQVFAQINDDYERIKFFKEGLDE